MSQAALFDFLAGIGFTAIILCLGYVCRLIQRHWLQTRNGFELLPTGQAMLVLNSQGYVIEANASACSLLGLSREDLLSRELTRLPVVSNNNTWQQLRFPLLTDRAHHFATQVSTPHHDVRDVEIDIHAVRQVESTCYLVEFRDVTTRNSELKTIQSQLKEHVDIRLALEISSIICITDTQGHIIHVNDKFCGMYQYHRAELLGKNPRILNSGHHSPEFFANLWHTIGIGQPWRNQICNQAKDGTLSWVDITITPCLDAEGKPYQFLAMSFDITPFKRAEEDRESAKQIAEKSSKAKADFLANMSHEIRTPMNGIVGMAQMLTDSGLSAEQMQYAKIILNSSDVLLSIINDILDYSKIESGQLDFEPIPFDLITAVEELVDMLQHKAEEKSFEFIVRFEPNLPNYIVGDPGRIRQILINLLSNAFKFTEHGHVIASIECRNITRDNATFFFSVEDTGKGIAAENIDRMFEKFTQEDPSSSRRYEGTGLGLAICKQLVEIMGGEIGVISEQGKGSTFWFTLTLPLADKARLLPATAPNIPDDLKVLVVDDYIPHLTVMSEQLQGWGIRHQCVPSATSALHELRMAQSNGEPFHIAILDYKMPEMNGAELALAIKADPEIARTELVMLTAYNQRGDAQRFQQCGFSAYLIKPPPQCVMLETLSTLWQKYERRLSESVFINRHTLREIRREIEEATRQIPIVEKPLRILLVEDNVVNQKVAVKLIQKFGATVDIAGNGFEALQMTSMIPYTMVFMDCQMPEMDGYEATRLIREREGDRCHVPIIALTAHAMKGDQEKCMAVGMDDYLAKPIAVDKLYELITYWSRPENNPLAWQTLQHEACDERQRHLA